jgi:hypothetical protein
MTIWKRYRLQEMADAQASAGGSATDTNTSGGSNTNAPAADSAQATQAQASDSGAPQQTPTDKPADSGATDGTVAAPAVPETYEFKMPEGVTLDNDVVGELSGIAKDAKLTQEQAQKIADLGAKMSQKWQSSQVEALAKLDQEWSASTTADPEIGGEKLEQSKTAAKKALTELGTPKLAELLETSRLGNHPEVIRLLSKVGAMVSPDSKVVTGSSVNPLLASAAQRMYPNMNP